MDVVGHQDECVDLALPLGSRLTEAFEEIRAIVVAEENGLSIVAPHDDVMGKSREIDSPGAGHGLPTRGRATGKTRANV
jgi:hypothetical protein